MPTETIEIPTDRGHPLAGSLELPGGLVRGAALYAHCFTCTKQSRAAVAVTRALARHGIACLRVDFTGLGGSGGNFGQAGFASDVEDLLDSAEYMAGRFGEGLLLVGHSLGGAAILASAGMVAEGRIAAIATMGAPADVPHVLGNVKGDLDAIERDGKGEVTIAGRRFVLTSRFLQRTREIDLLDEVSRIRVPLMICHAPTDNVVDIDNAGRIFLAAKHPKSFLSLAGADHLLSDDEDAEFAADVIAGWGRRYLPAPASAPAPEDGAVAMTGHGKFGTELVAGTHRLLADEPRSSGGENAGPTPYDLLTASLASCTAMTMKLYADRKAWPLDRVTVRVRHERNHRHEGEHVEAMAGAEAIQALLRDILIEGDLDDSQRARLMEIADRCPVHRTLEGDLHIHTSPA